MFTLPRGSAQIPAGSVPVRRAGPHRGGSAKGAICAGPQSKRGLTQTPKKISMRLTVPRRKKLLNGETKKQKEDRQILCAGQRGLKMTELRDEKAKKSSDSLCRTRGSENDRVARWKKQKIFRFFVPGKGARQKNFAPCLQKALGGTADVLPRRYGVIYIYLMFSFAYDTILHLVYD